LEKGKGRETSGSCFCISFLASVTTRKEDKTKKRRKEGTPPPGLLYAAAIRLQAAEKKGGPKGKKGKRNDRLGFRVDCQEKRRVEKEKKQPSAWPVTTESPQRGGKREEKTFSRKKERRGQIAIRPAFPNAIAYGTKQRKGEGRQKDRRRRKEEVGLGKGERRREPNRSVQFGTQLLLLCL